MNDENVVPGERVARERTAAFIKTPAVALAALYPPATTLRALDKHFFRRERNILVRAAGVTMLLA